MATQKFCVAIITYMKDKKILKGAIVLGGASFFAKILGAFYRVPLTNLLGSYGLGLYQMIFPVYALFLDFAGASVPSALSKIIAQGEDCPKSCLKSSKRLLFVFGLFFSLILAIFCKRIAIWQGNQNATLGYLFLAPSIMLFSLLSCYRGYFQGQLKMFPTALSQIIEQAIKLILGLLLVRAFLPNVNLAVAGATFAITVSEAVALLIIFISYKRQKPTQFYSLKTNFKHHAKTILKTALPITLSGMVFPLVHVIDSFLVVNMLSKYTDNATALYGVMSGVVLTIINLPVSVCHGIATVAVPAVSSAKEEDKIKTAEKTIVLTLLMALPCALFVIFFTPFSVNFLFGRLQSVEKTVAINLLRLTAPCIILIPFVQTTNGALIGKGKLYAPLVSSISGAIVKITIMVILLKIPSFNIYGVGIGLIACYFISGLINLIVITVGKVSYAGKTYRNRQYAS